MYTQIAVFLSSFVKTLGEPQKRPAMDNFPYGLVS